MKKLLTIIALVICLAVSHAVTRNVPGTYATIQAAINAASNTDTVLVETGTYYENINFRGKNIVVTSRYFQTLSTATIWGTTINGSTPVYPDSASCVIICGHEDSTAVLQGFNITGGKGTKWTDEHGAGIYREGGGVLIAFSFPLIQYNIIQNNACIDLSGVSSTGGGGMRIGDCYPRLFNNVVMYNTGRYGAGIVLNFSGCMMKNNIVYANYGTNSYGGGSGMWINSASTRPKLIENNTIVGNSTTTASCTGGIYFTSTAPTTIRNTIVWGNTSPSLPQIFGSTPTVVYCDVQGGFTGAGNLNLTPNFADSSFVLANGSPCIDAGDSSTVYNDLADSLNPILAKFPSKGGLRNDMGAFGGPLTRTMGAIPIGIQQISSNVPNGFVLQQNYPNPFNPSTSIVYQVPLSGTISIRLYDITGRLVKILVNTLQQAGTYKYEFDASNMPTGIYFYKLDGSGFSQTKKMILVK